MPIKVVLADETDMTRDAMRRILESERHIELVGEAGGFGQAMRMIADFRPEVLLLDLHMAEKRDFRPALVKSQLGCVCILAVSFSNDEEARQLAESYGALALLDKMKLFTEMIPAIFRCQPERTPTQANARCLKRIETGFSARLRKGKQCQAGEASVEIFRIDPAGDNKDKSR